MVRILQFLSLITLLVLSACSGKPEQAVSSGPRIAVIPKCTSFEFWNAVQRGADAAGNQLGADVIWRGTLRESDVSGQIALVEELVQAKVDGIVLAPIDEDALVDSVKKANAAKIPVVIIDSALQGGEYISFVATDNEQAGEVAGDYLARQMTDGGEVTLLRFQKGSASTEAREAGFLKAIRSANLLAIQTGRYGGATPESAYAEAEKLLALLADEKGEPKVGGIFCPNESTSFGMLRALQDRGWAGKVHFVGFDSSPLLLQALDKGEIDGLVVQNPYRMGFDGVQAIVESLKGEKAEPRIDTGAVLVTRDSSKDVEMRKLLY